MKGAIAAGHPLTADAGARILAEGGNAVDACIAAAFVSWVTESPLTGPGGGGFLLAHRARDRIATVLDFFVATPGLGFEGEREEMAGVDISFDGTTTQPFRVGEPSCAVPGAVAGLAEAHRLYGRLPWPILLEPAIELAATGFPLTKEQAFLHGVLDPVLRYRPALSAIYGGEACLVTGDTLRLADLADTLQRLAEEGPGTFYRGEIASSIAATVQEGGGAITEADLAAYRVVRRRPVRASVAGRGFASNPPPSSGGVLIAFALAVLDRLGGAGRDSVAAAARLAEVARETARLRTRGFASALHRGGLTAQILADATVSDAARRVSARAAGASTEPAALPSTTHISVVDEEQNAASLSASTGCGSGVIIPGTGIHLNNMLGETDLNTAGLSAPPGRRLTSMMSPSLVLAGDRPRLVIGSAGSERLRGAILQVTLDTVAGGRPLREAIDAPRLHLHGDRLHLEGGFDDGIAAGLEASGYDVIRWSDRNLYFGGVAAVALRSDGSLEAAGDPRRGGAAVVVE
jgi:gamma-glutamyltranspeptidase / glutathione hydrolase